MFYTWYYGTESTTGLLIELLGKTRIDLTGRGDDCSRAPLRVAVFVHEANAIFVLGPCLQGVYNLLLGIPPVVSKNHEKTKQLCSFGKLIVIFA